MTIIDRLKGFHALGSWKDKLTIVTIGQLVSKLENMLNSNQPCFLCTPPLN